MEPIAPPNAQSACVIENAKQNFEIVQYRDRRIGEPFVKLIMLVGYVRGHRRGLRTRGPNPWIRVVEHRSLVHQPM